MSVSNPFEEELSRFINRRRKTYYPKSDLEAAPAHLQEWMSHRQEKAAALLPACAELLANRAVRSVVPVTKGGTFHLLFRIEFAEGQAAFLRTGGVFADRHCLEFMVEQQLHPILAGNAIPVPELLETDLTRARFPLDFQIVAEAEGSPLNTLENPETQFLPDRLLEDFGRTMARWHQVEARGAGLLSPQADPVPQGVLEGWDDYLLLNLESHLAICESILAISPDEAERIRRLFAEVAPGICGGAVRLLHGDPGHHNVFAAGSRISAVIDWEDALAGDPVFDIAYWGTFVRDYLREPFLRGYREAGELPHDFELRYWLYYLRVAISKTVHRHLFGYPDRAGRPPASQRIQKALAHSESLI